MFHPLDWEWLLYNCLQKVAHMFKGCKTAAVVEQYAQAVCSRNGWDAGLTQFEKLKLLVLCLSIVRFLRETVRHPRATNRLLR
jgi:hypothetical protein